MGNIKGLLIDSGRVLNFAATRDWSYSPNFFKIVSKDKINNISKDKRDEAFRKAWSYINNITLMQTIEEEWKHFLEFFIIIKNELPELEIDDKILKLLTDDFVLNYDKYIFFKDVFEVLPILNQNYKLCLVSDAWPSLRNVYKKAGFYDYFDAIIISSEIGVTKPNEKMYKTAIKSLNLTSNEVIFIDDNPKNCEGALNLGIKSIVLNRNTLSRSYIKYIKKSNLHVVKDMYKLEKLLLKEF
jgi:putative hydrolase of the HAD superfamily